MPGDSVTQFPLSPGCPADFMLNMDALQRLNISGVPLPVREFSFLDNERTPAAVKVTASPAVSRALCSPTRALQPWPGAA